MRPGKLFVVTTEDVWTSRGGDRSSLVIAFGGGSAYSCAPG
jgi:hypothetical protein